MLEYGPDVVATRRLVAQLGIENNVSWFPLMARKELMIGISLADIVCGEYENSWNFGGTIVEGIAMGKPLLHYRNDALYPKDDLFPIMNVACAEDITRALGEYVADRERFMAMGKAAHAWFREHIVERPVEVLRGLVDERRR
jgi:glycosyltransferase involved in cell wall biosynthesis